MLFSYVGMQYILATVHHNAYYDHTADLSDVMAAWHHWRQKGLIYLRFDIFLLIFTKNCFSLSFDLVK